MTRTSADDVPALLASVRPAARFVAAVPHESALSFAARNWAAHLP